MTIHGIIETAIYFEDLDETEAFYRTLLSLTASANEPSRHVFSHVGASSVLLAFVADTTIKGDHLRSHGARVPGQFALGIDTGALDAWRRKLQENGVAIEREVEWPRSSKSIYLRDPARK